MKMTQIFCSLCGKSCKKWCSFKKHLHRDHGKYMRSLVAAMYQLVNRVAEIEVQINILGVFYYVLGNICPIFRSSLQCIQLIAEAKSSDIRICSERYIYIYIYIYIHTYTLT